MFNGVKKILTLLAKYYKKMNKKSKNGYNYNIRTLKRGGSLRKYLSKKEIDNCLMNKDYETIVANFTPLVASISSNFYINNYSKEDLMATGMLGLMEGINKIPISKDKKPISYFYRSIENELINAFNKEKRNIKSISLNGELFRNDENEYSLEHFLKEEVDFDENIRISETKELINKLLKTLSEDNRLLIERRYGLNGYERCTQQQLADSLGMKRSTLAMKERRIMKSLRKELKIL